MNKVCHHKSTLSICALGSSLGIVFAAANVVMIVSRVFLGLPNNNMMHISGVARLGTGMSILDFAFCIVWSIAAGFVFGALIAALYNFILRRCSCRHCSKHICCESGEHDKHICCTKEKCTLEDNLK